MGQINTQMKTQTQTQQPPVANNTYNFTLDCLRGGGGLGVGGRISLSTMITFLGFQFPIRKIHKAISISIQNKGIPSHIKLATAFIFMISMNKKSKWICKSILKDCFPWIPSFKIIVLSIFYKTMSFCTSSIYFNCTNIYCMVCYNKERFSYINST